jgi:tRNA (pseudouridine54-N1)-methyltransferase
MIISRDFYVKSNAFTFPQINFKDLPGSTGRLDIIARCVNTSFWLSYGIRKNVTFHTILHGVPSPPVYIRFEGDKLKKVTPDERNIAMFIQKSLERMQDGREIESTPGVFVSKKDFKSILEDNRDKDIYFLEETGEHIKTIKISDTPFFVLGDNKDLQDSEKNILHTYGAQPVSIGLQPYLSSHCITVLNWLMDVY